MILTAAVIACSSKVGPHSAITVTAAKTPVPDLDKILPEYDPELASSDEETLDVDLVEIFHRRSESDRRPFTKVKIHDTETEALLDSGANCTVIDEQFAKNFNLTETQTKPGKFRIRTVDNTVHKCTIQYLLQYHWMGITQVIPTVILPRVNLNVILGIDFWDLYSITPQINVMEVDDVEADAPLRFNHKLSETQQEQLDQTIKILPFSMPGVIGKTHLLQHTIDTGTAEPTRRKAYVISPYMEAKVNTEIDRMLALDVIEPAQSAWNNAMVIVKKPNGKIRYCIDARALNAVTKRDAYPLPNINRILGRLSHTRYLSSIDLSDAFWQVELREEDRPKTAFAVSGRGFYQFKRMPFGLVNSASTLCKLIDRVIGEDLEPKVFRYLDDFIIATKSFQEHMNIIKIIAERLRNAGLTISVEKSKFCLKQLTYVGYLIDEFGCRPDPAKTLAVTEYPAPTSIKEVRRFYGMAAWYRRFIKNFAEITAPVAELMKTKTKTPIKFKWTRTAQEAFDKIKQCLTSAPVLSMPQVEGEWILETDASDTGMGGCLKQIQDGIERVIVYYSKKFSRAQQKYTVTERECLAVITFIEKARPYIEGVSNFTVVTDHASLKWLQNLKDPHGRLARWALRMQAYNYTIVHRAGSKMVVPDALSRSIALVEVTDDTLKNDVEYARLYNEVSANPSFYPMYRLQSHTLYRKGHTAEENFSSRWKIYVPSILRAEVMKSNHDDPTAAHGGVFKTLHRIRQDYFWPNMKRDIIEYIKNCLVCKRIKPVNKNQQAPMGKDRTPACKFRVICIDFIGPLPTSSRSNQWILVCVDHFTKFVTIVPLRRATAEKTVQVLEDNVFSKFGFPETIILDNGSQLKSKIFRQYALKHKINLWYSAVYHPQANPAEASNHSVIKALRAYIKGEKSQRKWDSDLQMLACALNSSVHTATGVTPYMAVFGENIALSGNDHRLRLIDDDVENIDATEKFKRIKTKMQLQLEKAYEQRARRYNLRAREIDFKIGDPVLKKTFKLAKAANNYTPKLDYQYEPVQIHEIVGSNCYRVIDTAGNILPSTYSSADLRGW